MRTDMLLGLAAALLAAACSKSSDTPRAPTAPGDPAEAPPTPLPVPAAGDGTIRALAPAATGGAAFSAPMDATLSPDGKTAYFIALAPDGAPAIFRSGAPASGPPQLLASGAPLSAPFGLDITSDGKTLVIADPGAQGDVDPDRDEERGQLLTLSAAGGRPAILAGAAGHAPRGVVVMAAAGGDQVTFTGSTPEGEPGLFRIAAAGGAVTTLASGAPFTDPSGLAVTAGGDAFVVDTAGNESVQARLIHVQAGKATVLLDDLRVGFPAGVALSGDEKTVLLSALDPDRRTDLVIRYRVDTREIEQISDPIKEFSEPAGLHRAKNVETYIWADSSANGSGTVYVINPQP